MAEDEDKGLGSAPELPVTIFSHEGPGLTADGFKELKSKYGLDVRVRTTKPGLDTLMAAASDVDGYDRTFPGYDRSYDRS